MSLRRRRVEEEGSESINASPLIDAFLSSSSFSCFRNIRYCSRRRGRDPQLRRPSPAEKLRPVRTFRTDEIFHAGKRVSLEEIPHLIEIASKNRPKPVVIQVDKWADASLMSKIVEKARRNAPSISIATRKSR